MTEKVTKIFDIAKEGEWMIASTPAADREKDRVIPVGIGVQSFGRNPVLLYGHNYSDPWAVIGRVAEFAIGQDFRFRPELRAPANDNDPMTIIRALWDGGLLRAASIGFIPTEYERNELGGYDYKAIDLLEISLVPVPANAEALRLAAKGLVAKRGRVLSGRNEKRIREAIAMLEAVLSELEDLADEEPVDMPMDEDGSRDDEDETRGTKDGTTNDPTAKATPNNDAATNDESTLAAAAGAVIGLLEQINLKFQRKDG